jgi:hypothetical protein
MLITAKLPKNDPPLESKCEYNTGASLQEKVDLFGEKAVNDLAEDTLIIDIQAVMRRAMAAGKTQDEIQELVSSYKPGVSVRIAVDPVKAAAAQFDKMTAEEQQKYIEDLINRQKTA